MSLVRDGRVFSGVEVALGQCSPFLAHIANEGAGLIVWV